MKKLLLSASALVAAVSPSFANAAIVYNNGAPNTSSGNETVAWVQAEDFKFASNTAINSAGVYLAGFGGIGNWDGQFQYTIFGDAGGSPGAALQSGSASITPTNTGGAWCCGDNAYLFAFNLASTFNAAAGSTYWLGIHAGAVGNFNRDDIYWVSTGSNGTLAGNESFGGTLTNWASNGAEHAFYLDGARLAGIPEPAAWAMMLAGFGLVGAAMRRREKVAVTFA